MASERFKQWRVQLLKVGERVLVHAYDGHTYSGTLHGVSLWGRVSRVTLDPVSGSGWRDDVATGDRSIEYSSYRVTRAGE